MLGHLRLLRIHEGPSASWSQGKGRGGGGGSSGDGTDFHSSIRAQGIVQLYATSPYTV